MGSEVWATTGLGSDNDVSESVGIEDMYMLDHGNGGTRESGEVMQKPETVGEEFGDDTNPRGIATWGRARASDLIWGNFCCSRPRKPVRGRSNGSKVLGDLVSPSFPAHV